METDHYPVVINISDKFYISQNKTIKTGQDHSVGLSISPSCQGCHAADHTAVHFFICTKHPTEQAPN